MAELSQPGPMNEKNEMKEREEEEIRTRKLTRALQDSWRGHSAKHQKRSMEIRNDATIASGHRSL
jgi:hypothetical protein